MSNHSQTTKQDIAHTNVQDGFGEMSNGNLECFRCVLSEVSDEEIRTIEETVENMEMPRLSRRHKIRMNRLFRERVGGAFLPFPDVDNLYERARSKLVIKFKIHQILDHRKKRRSPRRL